MAEKKEFRFESIQDAETIKKYLEELTSGFEKGQIVLKNGGENIVLNPEGVIQFEVKVRKKDGKSRLYLKMDWKDTENNDNPKLEIK